MSVRLISILLAVALGCATDALAKPQLGVQKFFKDWAVACDNIMSCAAVALEPESFPSNGLYLFVSRDLGEGTLTVRFAGEETKSDHYRIFIDGRLVDSGVIAKGTGSNIIEIAGPDALKLARAIARGTVLLLDDGQGSTLGKGSLLGSAAAFRLIDRMQSRVGTPQALVMTGRKSTRPRLIPKPVITAARIGATGDIPDASAIVELVESSGCTENRIGVTEDAAHSLGRTKDSAKALILVHCGTGAYNISFYPYVGTLAPGGRWKFEPARFDHDAVKPDKDGIVWLINAEWDAPTQQLSNYSKGRGVGDCGSSEAYVWDGAMFRLVEASGMEKCRGSLDWLTLWRADVQLID